MRENTFRWRSQRASGLDEASVLDSIDSKVGSKYGGLNVQGADSEVVACFARM